LYKVEGIGRQTEFPSIPFYSSNCPFHYLKKPDIIRIGNRRAKTPVAYSITGISAVITGCRNMVKAEGF